MIDISVKQNIRDFFKERLDARRKEAMVYGFPVGIILREDEVEKFIDDLWVAINK